MDVRSIRPVAFRSDLYLFVHRGPFSPFRNVMTVIVLEVPSSVTIFYEISSLGISSFASRTHRSSDVSGSGPWHSIRMFPKIVSWIGADIDQIGYVTLKLRTNQTS